MKKFLIVSCLATTVLVAQETNPDKRLRNAAGAFEELMGSPDKGIPQDLFE